MNQLQPVARVPQHDDDDEFVELTAGLAAAVTKWLEMVQSSCSDTLHNDRVLRVRPKEMSGHFELDRIEPAKALSLFRFTVDQIDMIVQCMQLPPLFITDNGVAVTARVGLAILLRRLAYPARLDDLSDTFQRGRTQLSRIITTVGLHIIQQYRQLLYLHPSIDSNTIHQYATVITRSWPYIEGVWAFIDGSKHYHCRPIWGQRSMYSGHKKQHCFSWQAITAPDGLIVSLFGPHPGHDNDAGMLRDSQILTRLSAFDCINGVQHVLFGDGGYYNRTQLAVPFQEALTDAEETFNRCTSAMRIAVEHSFKLVHSNWAYITFKPGQKALLQPTGAYYALAVLFTNMHTCINGRNQISDFFGTQPMSLNEYLNP